MQSLKWRIFWYFLIIDTKYEILNVKSPVVKKVVRLKNNVKFLVINNKYNIMMYNINFLVLNKALINSIVLNEVVSRKSQNKALAV